MILSCTDISKSFGTDVILDNISFNLDKNDKLAIVGVNGAGKTTLLKIITGQLPADRGEVYIQNHIKPGYMAQLLDMESGNTVEQELLKAFDDLIRMEKELLELSEAMALGDSRLHEIMKSYDRLSFEFESRGGFQYKSEVRGIINGMGFGRFDGLTVDKLSGGQKTQVSLGKLLLSKPDILILDEPTNHLDIDSIKWLEDYLKNYQKAIILVSHDRYFLDKTANKVLEIENNKAAMYNGNYTFYAKQKETDRQNALKRYMDQQKIIHKQEESIKKLKSFNREKSVRRAESKQKQLDKLERAEKPESLPDTIYFNLNPKIESGNDVLSVKGLKKAFGDKLIFENAGFEIKKGEKAALIGPNGVGKTTLLRILLGETEASGGEYKLGHNVRPGYYDQGQFSLDKSKRIIDQISDHYPNLTLGEIRNVLASFVFTGDDVYKLISSLSGGERGRLLLVKIMLSGANFLLLDEPTNYLDINSKEVLENALKDYGGTILFISHDRYFINSCADKIIELDQNGATVYSGDYEYYLEKKAEKEWEKEETTAAGGVKESWAKKKDEEAAKRKMANRLKNVNKEISETEALIDEINENLEKDHINTDYEKARAFYEELEQAESRLLGLYEELEELEGSLG